MSFLDFLARMKFSQTNAETIFDRDEPIGRPTDLVLPVRKSRAHSAAADRANSFPVFKPFARR